MSVLAYASVRNRWDTWYFVELNVETVTLVEMTSGALALHMMLYGAAACGALLGALLYLWGAWSSDHKSLRTLAGAAALMGIGFAALAASQMSMYAYSYLWPARGWQVAATAAFIWSIVRANEGHRH
ncbi:MAG: hypothetical protein UZ22_OP11002000826 [Microgenomates bacterium OLB23]|nr:MAG: hypothetical protein UZ22_OP11002000826 [Microgenomates bacterium OLB23]